MDAPSLPVRREARFDSLFEAGRFVGALAERESIIHDAHVIRLYPALYALNNVVAIPQDWGFLTQDNRMIVDGTAINPFLIRKGRFPWIRPLGDERCLVSVKAAPVVDEPILFVGGDFWGNYYHWLLDFFPRLVAFQHLRESFTKWGVKRIALLRDIPAFAHDMLHLLGYQNEDILWIDANRAWPFRSAYVFSNFSQYGFLHQRGASILQDILQAPAPVLGSRRLYVSRQDATRRRLHNENEVFSTLERNGFELIVPGKLSFQEQRQIFSEAEIIVGPHGAGLVNMIFAGRGATVIELRSNAGGLQHFAQLAQALGQRYVAIAASKENTDIPGNHNSDFYLDPAQVESVTFQSMAAESRPK